MATATCHGDSESETHLAAIRKRLGTVAKVYLTTCEAPP